MYTNKYPTKLCIQIINSREIVNIQKERIHCKTDYSSKRR